MSCSVKREAVKAIEMWMEETVVVVDESMFSGEVWKNLGPCRVSGKA